MARFEVKIYVEKKTILEALVIMEAQLSMYQMPDITKTMGFKEKLGLKSQIKILKKTINRFKEVTE